MQKLELIVRNLALSVYSRCDPRIYEISKNEPFLEGNGWNLSKGEWVKYFRVTDSTLWFSSVKWTYNGTPSKVCSSSVCKNTSLNWPAQMLRSSCKMPLKSFLSHLHRGRHNSRRSLGQCQRLPWRVKLRHWQHGRLVVWRQVRVSIKKWGRGSLHQLESDSKIL